MTYDVGNPDPDLGRHKNVVGLNQLNEIPILPSYVLHNVGTFLKWFEILLTLIADIIRKSNDWFFL